MTAPNVLIVDDNKDALAHLQKLFENAGATVTVAQDGNLAIQEFDKNDISFFKLIGVDIRMPGMKGTELAKQLRDKGFKGSMIGFSAVATVDDKKVCDQVGINSFFSKSVISKDVVEALISGLR